MATGIADEERKAQEELERKVAEEQAEKERIAEAKRKAEEEKRREEEAKRLGEEMVSFGLPQDRPQTLTHCELMYSQKNRRVLVRWKRMQRFRYSRVLSIST